MASKILEGVMEPNRPMVYLANISRAVLTLWESGNSASRSKMVSRVRGLSMAN